MTDKQEKQATPVSSVRIDKRLCKACGLCIAFCPRKVLRQGTEVNDLGYRASLYDGTGCIGCGTCYYVCPELGAVMVERPARDGSDRREPQR